MNDFDNKNSLYKFRSSYGSSIFNVYDACTFNNTSIIIYYHLNTPVELTYSDASKGLHPISLLVYQMKINEHSCQ